MTNAVAREAPMDAGRAGTRLNGERVIEMEFPWRIVLQARALRGQPVEEP